MAPGGAANARRDATRRASVGWCKVRKHAKPVECSSRVWLCCTRLCTAGDIGVFWLDSRLDSDLTCVDSGSTRYCELHKTVAVDHARRPRGLLRCTIRHSGNGVVISLSHQHHLELSSLRTNEFGLGELGLFGRSIPRCFPQILSDSLTYPPAVPCAHSPLLLLSSLFVAVSNMSSADAKPLPFVYQFAAGKSQLPTLGGAPMHRVTADILISSWESCSTPNCALGGRHYASRASHELP
jgi:hypothetical protein